MTTTRVVPPSAVTSPGSPDVRPRLVLAILSLAAFMASLDLFIVNVAFNAIGRSFYGASSSGLSWILNGYSIIYAALLVPAGRLADRVGRRRGFVAGLLLFTVASGACALSANLGELIAFRALQALGAAALTPASLGLLLPVFPPERRHGAVRIWAATGALAAALGPVLGGFLVQASWRWVFLVNIPIGLATIAATLRYVPDSKEAEAGRIPDLAGALLIVLSVGALALGLVQGESWGWASLRTSGCWVLAVVTGVVFWVRSSRHPAPVVEPALLRVRAFAWSNVTALLFSVAFGANLLVATLWMQRVWHYGPIATGLAIAPGPLMVQPFALLGGLAQKRGVSVGRIAAAGCVLLAIGAGLTAARIGVRPDYLAELFPSQLIVGAGVGFALPTILSAATADLPAHRASTGSAVVTMARQLGTVVGISALIAILGVPLTALQALHAFQHGWLLCCAAALAAGLAALRGMTPRRAQPMATSQPAPLVTAATAAPVA